MFDQFWKANEKKNVTVKKYSEFTEIYNGGGAREII
jgi:hypothetical protein